MAGEGFIETGVDKLVKLVEAKKKISTSEAAKLLGASNAVIDVWADFLEEEGIISLEYKLATTYLGALFRRSPGGRSSTFPSF